MTELEKMFADMFNIGREFVRSTYDSANSSIVKSINTVNEFTFNDAISFLKEKICTVTNASKCLIAVNNRYDSPMPLAEKSPQVEYIVRLIILDSEENPIYSTEDSYVGRVIYTNSIDNQLQRFLNGEKKRILSEEDFPKKIFTYKELKEYILDNKKDILGAKKILISVFHENDIPNFSANTGKNKLVVRLIFADANGNGIYKDIEKTSYCGKMIIVDDIDEDLKSYMNGEVKKSMNI